MKIYTTYKERGFALISTLSIMALLVMLVIGMMSLATTETKLADATKYEMEAKANARMALMIALGELQEAMGPDQRISASSNILDTNQATEDIDGVVSQNVLGVWDSWNTYITDPLDASHPSAAGSTIANSYVDGRSPLFRKWLISHDNASETTTWNSVRGGFKFSKEVLMVGEGSMGSADPAGQVKAGLVPTTDAAGKESGGYAWWVGGENLKTDLTVAEGKVPNVNGDDLTDIQANNSAPMLIDPSGHDAYTNFSRDEEVRSKLITSGQAGLETSTPSEAKDGFFDYTVGSLSVLADVRMGGTKRDLNLLFENDVFPSEYSTVTALPWNQAVTIDPTIRSLDGQVASKAQGLRNPHTTLPSWKKLRSYYRLYRSPDGHGVDWNGDFPFTRTKMFTKKLGTSGGKMANYPDYQGYTRMPIILRQAYLLALRKTLTNNDTSVRLELVSVPILSLWNPYNVELKFDVGQLQTNMKYPHVFRLLYKLEGVSNPVTNWKEVPNPLDSLQSWAGIAIHDRLNSTSSEIVMKPGEFALWSVGSSQSTEENVAYRGLLSNTNDPLLGEWSLLGTRPASEIKNATPTVQLAFGGSSPTQFLDRFGGGTQSMAVLLKDLNINNNSLYNITPDDVNGENLIAVSDNNFTYGILCDWTGAKKGATPTEIVPSSSPARYGSQYDKLEYIGIIECIAKSGQQFERYSSGSPSVGVDYRNKSWLHAAPIHTSSYNLVKSSIAKTNFPYAMHYRDLNGLLEVGSVLQVESDGSTYMGAGYTPDTGVTRMSMLELPTAPITSLGGFASFRMRPSPVHTIDTSVADGFFNPYWKHVSHHGASFSMGIGNGYAHPMVPENDVLQTFTGTDWIDVNDIVNGKANGTNNSYEDVISTDYWDQLLITNDALYDNWFCSAVAPKTSKGIVNKNISSVFGDFVDKEDSLINHRHIAYVPAGMSEQEVKDSIVDQSGAITADAYQKVGSYMMLKGGFNVNSTSVNAWKALLYGLKEEHQIAYGSGSTPNEVSVDDGGQNNLIVSRFGWAPNNNEASTAVGDEAAWTGIRKLTAAQIDKLSEEIVHQVKRRGPFLNMSEFINRRVGDSNESRLNQAGTIQAAIDWDEFANDYNGSGDTGKTSINGIFKNSASEDMITSVAFENPNDAYPNPKAANGSRYSGIPGYVMASDILKVLGDTLVVRDDTFTIRAYGESKSASGEVRAKAWCEAKVQRYPDYVDLSDDPWTQGFDKLGAEVPTANGGLSAENQKYGRKFRIVSFRWLSREEI
jgi:hypothetical protein